LTTEVRYLGEQLCEKIVQRRKGSAGLSRKGVEDWPQRLLRRNRNNRRWEKKIPGGQPLWEDGKEGTPRVSRENEGKEGRGERVSQT